jgi:hypothetical protein
MYILHTSRGCLVLERLKTVRSLDSVIIIENYEYIKIMLMI